jgi:small-conductance mechanosensitive channel
MWFNMLNLNRKPVQYRKYSSMFNRNLNFALLCVMISFLNIVTVNAQSPKETTKTDSLVITEALIVKDHQQQQIDSLVKIQLEKEKKTLELEKQLREIASKDSIRKIEQVKKIQALKKVTKGFPVVLKLDTLFYIYTGIGSFNAQERAGSITKRIENLYEDPFYNADSLTINQNEETYELTYKKTNIILSVANTDGLWLNKTNEALAKEYLGKIKEIITKERKEYSLVNWFKRIGLVMLIIIFLWFVIYGINRLFRRSAGLISKYKSKYVNGLKLGTIKLFTPQHLEKVLLQLNNVVRIIVIILLVYLSLPLLFSIFPETEQWTGTLLQWILSPLSKAFNAVVSYLPDLVTVIVIYYIFKYVIRAVKYYFNEIRRGHIIISGFHKDWAIPTFNILRILLYAFMLVIVFPYLPGSKSAAFQGVSVFLGILISLGSSSAITNIVAGLVITYMRPFKVGDRVKIGDVVGDVLEKTMLVTRIKTIKNEDITVPNSTVLSSSTINYSTNTKEGGEGLILNYTMTLGYDIPWTTIHKLMLEAADRTEDVLKEPKPFILQTGLDDFYVSYQLNTYIKEANKQAVIYSNLYRNTLDVFNDAGVEILSPHYRAVRDGNPPAMPPKED